MSRGQDCLPLRKRGVKGATPSGVGSSPDEQVQHRGVSGNRAAGDAFQRPSRPLARAQQQRLDRFRHDGVLHGGEVSGLRAASMRVITLSPKRICSLKRRPATASGP